MNRIILGTAIALGLSAPSLAATQLETALGVTPGAYTTAELIDLNRAYEENDQSRVTFILSGGSNPVDPDNAGTRQLATSLGVSADAFTLAELIDLQRAVEDNDQSRIAFILSHDGDTGVTVSGRDGVSGGKAQFAASLGVNAADFTLAQLIDLQRATEENDQSRIAFILGNAS
jgi:hypothetical protein